MEPVVRPLLTVAKRIEGNIPEMMDQALAFVQKNMRTKTNPLVCPESLVLENTTERDDDWKGFRTIGYEVKELL